MTLCDLGCGHPGLLFVSMRSETRGGLDPRQTDERAAPLARRAAFRLLLPRSAGCEQSENQRPSIGRRPPSDERIGGRNGADVSGTASYLESLNPEQRRAVEHGAT